MGEICLCWGMGFACFRSLSGGSFVGGDQGGYLCENWIRFLLLLSMIVCCFSCVFCYWQICR